MTNFLVKRLPAYVNQFAPSPFAKNPSGYRCVTASAAMAIDFAYPGGHDPYQLEHDLYVQYAGPDVPSDENGLSKDQLKEILTTFHVGFIDMDPLVQEGLNGNPTPLLQEMEAQTKQDVLQIITVADESFLKEAGTGKKLHNWVDNGLKHCFVRVGFSDDLGYGEYLEPAAPLFCQDAQGHEKPVAIAWSDIVSAKIITAIAIMPYGVPVPPVGFSYQHGVWPVPPKPPINVDRAEQLLLQIIAECQADKQAKQQQLDRNRAMQQALQAEEQELQQQMTSSDSMGQALSSLQGIIKADAADEAQEAA